MDELPGYRPVSVLAVAALCVGICSSSALVAPILWMLPLVGAGLAAAALLDTGRAPAGKAGRGAALAGWALSLGFAAQVAATAATTHWLECRRAEATARWWLEAVCAGRLTDATSVASPPGDATGGEKAVAAAAAICGPGRAVRCEGAGLEAGSWSVRADGADAAVRIQVSRLSDGGRPERWRVAGCEPVMPTPN